MRSQMSPRRARWEAVYDDLRRRIDQGELPAGATLPGELALCEEHGVSRPTVRTALTHLEQEGLITAGAGRLGRQVRGYDPAVWHLTEWERGDRRDDPARGVDDWAADMLAQGKKPRQTVEVRGVPAPKQVAGWLDVPIETMLVRRRRIRTADDTPVSIADSWFPPDIADRECEVDGQRVKPIMVERDIAVAGGFVRAIGVHQVEFRDEVRVRMPSPEEAQLLKLGTGSPVGEHARVGIDDQGRRVRVIVSVFPGNRMYLAYTLEA